MKTAPTAHTTLNIKTMFALPVEEANKLIHQLKTVAKHTSYITHTIRTHTYFENFTAHLPHTEESNQLRQKITHIAYSRTPRNR